MRLLVLYGSQTGTAQDVAEHIWREAKKLFFSGPVLAMDEYPVQNLVNERFVVFVVATTGDGEEPENMKEFWKFLLRKNLPLNSLEHLQFACLGLGDSSYSKYNYVGKKLFKRLTRLSALPIIPLGLCDDQHDHGISATFIPWMSSLNKKFNKISLERSNHEIEANLYKWDVQLSTDEQQISLHKDLQWFLKDKCVTLCLQDNRRTTTEDHFQDVRLLRFTFPFDFGWNPGDILKVLPQNSDETLADFFDILSSSVYGFNEKTVVKFRQIHEEMPLPLAYRHPATLKMMAKYYWDLSAIPRQRAFELLAISCEDETEKEKLLYFSSPEGIDDLVNYVNRPKRTILEVLCDFKHATSTLTLQILFELFQSIKPRYFSIASVPETGTLDLLVAVVEYKTKIFKPRIGLCSNWLKNVPVNSKIYAAWKLGSIKIPSDNQVPIIMVGPGTGVAPFRSLLLRREAIFLKQNLPSELTIFLGFRNKLKDFHCQEDFERFEHINLAKIFKAFSRDQSNKLYVQHSIVNNGYMVKDYLIDKNGIVFVAGSSKNMPKAVREAFMTVMEVDSDFIEDMIKSKRYQEETWS